MYKTCFMFLFINSLEALVPIVETPLGKIIGSHKESFSGRKYRAFEGIPYAIPPIGDRRFEPPEEIQKWNNTLYATNSDIFCQQIFLLYNIVFGTEDCLYLNIYIPSLNTKKLLPVLFFIHGGSFYHGSGTELGPKYIMDKDIIFVSINYRLGPFGFLSTEDSLIPGNMGLKDQSMALKWVNKYIKHFGGDPKKVTIFGASSGAVSVHYHYFSPMSKGLFQNGISISGNVFNSWAIAKNSLEKALKLGSHLNCPIKNIKKMIQCLKNQPAEALAASTKYFKIWKNVPLVVFGPVIETDSEQPFIDKQPIEIINNGDVEDVPWILTATHEEGMCLISEYFGDNSTIDELDKKWNYIAPYLLNYYSIRSEESSAITQEIKNFYIGQNKQISKESIPELIKMVGDGLFYSDIEDTLKLMSKVNKSPVRFYMYDYRANNSVSEVLSNTNLNYGVAHGDDITLILNNTFMQLTPQDISMQKILIDLFASYSESGVPEIGLNWPEINFEKNIFEYLYIKSPQELKIISSKTIDSNKNLWREI